MRCALGHIAEVGRAERGWFRMLLGRACAVLRMRVILSLSLWKRREDTLRCTLPFRVWQVTWLLGRRDFLVLGPLFACLN